MIDLHEGPWFPADFTNTTPDSTSASIAFFNLQAKQLYKSQKQIQKAYK